jgi:hypothetical protein
MMPRPRKLSVDEEAALVVMKRAGAPDKEIMRRFQIGRQTLYDALRRAALPTEIPRSSQLSLG